MDYEKEINGLKDMFHKEKEATSANYLKILVELTKIQSLLEEANYSERISTIEKKYVTREDHDKLAEKVDCLENNSNVSIKFIITTIIAAVLSGIVGVAIAKGF